MDFSSSSYNKEIKTFVLNATKLGVLNCSTVFYGNVSLFFGLLNYINSKNYFLGC